jgi:Glyoxalase-like domain
MTTSIQVVFDTADPEREARFWAAALGYQLQPPPPGFDSWAAFLREQGVPEDQWNAASAVTDPEGKEPRVYFQQVPEGKVAKNRMHLDLNVGGGSKAPIEERRLRVRTEVERLKALGASDERGAIDKGEESWVRMNDPEGNEFCVQ